MKVALIANDRFPVAIPFAGGLESFTWHLARGLRSAGAAVTLFAGPGSDPALQAEEIGVEPMRLSGAARTDVGMPPERQVAETFAYLQVMRALAERDDIDVVHNNSLHYLPIALSSQLTPPVLTTLHTPPHPWIEPALRLVPGAPTAAVSAAVARMWRHTTQATVIPNGVDLGEWTPGPGGDELAWVGRIVPEKAPHLAAAIARAAERPLRIAGPILDRDYFRTRLQPQLGDGVEYAGHLAPAELNTLLGSSAACLVTPAWDEPYGLVAAESMGCGTPVLALARGGLADLVRAPGGHAIAPESTPDEAAAALAGVMALDRAQVRAYAQEHCSLAATVDRYLDLYRRLAAR